MNSDAQKTGVDVYEIEAWSKEQRAAATVLEIMACPDDQKEFLSATECAVRNTRQHPEIWRVLYKNYYEPSERKVTGRLASILALCLELDLSPFRVLSDTVAYLAIHSSHFEHLYCRLLFLVQADRALLIQQLALRKPFQEIIHGDCADPRLKELIGRDVPLLDPENHEFFGLLAMLKDCSCRNMDKTHWEHLRNAIAVLPSGRKALEEGGYYPFPKSYE